MPWRRIGVATAVIVASLMILGRTSTVVVDWTWLSTVGYVGVFWIVFATKAILVITVFAGSALVPWVNGALALWFAWQIPLPLQVTHDPSL